MMIKTGSSQPCLPDGFIFTTQSQIDSFQIIYPNCHEIEGDIHIFGTDIVNLNGLINVTEFYGNVSIEYTSLPDLSGLDSVISIGGNLKIGDWYFGNYDLTSLEGLNNLSYIAGELTIARNTELINLIGLDNLDSVGGNLNIGYWDWDCVGNPSLLSLAGLENLISIGGTLGIRRNKQLISFTGLLNLVSVHGSLDIYDNDNLNSLTGLDNIDANLLNSLFIEYNNSLSTCEILSICNYLENNRRLIYIHDNSSGCNSPEEVENACLIISISEVNIGSKFFIYPNPAKNKLFISSSIIDLIMEINIYNQHGKKVFHEIGIPDIIDVSILEQGIYIIEIITGNLRIREKLIIKG